MNPEEFDCILELKRQSIPIWKQIVIDKENGLHQCTYTQKLEKISRT